MARNRQSAKSAGAKFERAIADYLAQHLDDRIDRRVRTGAQDRGDIAGVRTHDNQRVVAECKNTTRTALPAWTAEAHTEANNDGALVGVVIHKRHGTADPGRQWVAMTVDDLLALLDGQRHGHRQYPDPGEKTAQRAVQPPESTPADDEESL